MLAQKMIGRHIHNEAPDAWVALHLTIAQLKCLMLINFKGSTNFKMLAEALNVSPPNVTGIVDRLVVQKLVTREDNPENRRMQILQVTDKGRALIGELMERQEYHFHTTLANMKTEDLECLSRGMSALVEAAQQGEKQRSAGPEE